MTFMTILKTAGVSLVGVLLGIALGSIIVGALALFVGRGVNVSREQTEQVRTTEDARVQIERMGDAIRDARSLDLNSDGLASSTKEEWLQAGQDFSIQFYTNFDSDSDIELVRYFVEGVDLKRGIRDPYISPSEQVTTIARSVRNVAAGEPLFRYYAGSRGEIERVEIRLLVDVSPTQKPDMVTVTTVVAPRASRLFFTFPPSPTPSPTVSPSP